MTTGAQRLPTLICSPETIPPTVRAGPASTFLIPESGVCAQLSDELAVSASGRGVEASTAIVVTPVPLPPLYCGPAGAAAAQPRLTG
jgi:hypothetical protein